ncbi:MAG: SDR family NAD(P)-dependent oxidoreductase, partial [Acidimicrobiales bacterium]
MSTATDLDGRVALVSGGARGLGRGITDGLLAAGARVAVCGRSQPDELPAGARFFGADVRDAGAVDGLVAAVAEHYGRLDIAVNNAGGSPVAEAATAAPAFSTAI